MKALSICERYAATFDSNDKYGLLLHCAADSTAECVSTITKVVSHLGSSIVQADSLTICKNLQMPSGKSSREYKRLLSCDLLIIERLDALLDSSSDVYMVEHIYDVIDGRYKSGKPMVVTIDHDPMSLRDALQEQQQRILDRILERCYPIA